ncbi:MAG: transketolase family protein [Coriobacteriia bacterium]|nr:transketolase family protein [Coriobacteriia bacterium]
MVSLAESGRDVYAVDADLAGSTTTAKLAAYAASRHVNVGIAEQNMVGVAAGISLVDPGKLVFTGSFAIFGTGRVYDQIRNTVCYSNLNVKIAPTHAGISTGADGGSHQMVEDIALMRALPAMRVLVPADYHAAAAALAIAAHYDGPFYVRLGRHDVPQIYGSDSDFSLGRAQLLRPGSDISIIACGIEVYLALEAAEALAAQGISAEVIDAFSIKPLDAPTILASVNKTGRALTCEEHSVIGGLGSAVAELIAEQACPGIRFGRLGVLDRFGSSGGFDELFGAYGLDSGSICAAVVKLCDKGGSERDVG